MSGSLELWPAPPHGGPPGRLHRLRRNIRELPCALLLGVQLLALLAYPYMETAQFGGVRHLGRALFGVVGLVVLFLAIRAVRLTPAHTWIAALIGIPVVGLTIAEALWPGSDPVLFWSSTLHALFYFYTGYALLRYMFADNWVTKDELFATGATFTVVAWGFAYLYVAVQMIWPHSFTAYGETVAGERTWFQLLFLSVTTMTSTGLSDIMPVTAHARSFVMLEQITGMLYVALVVARLVGLTIARFRNS